VKTYTVYLTSSQNIGLPTLTDSLFFTTTSFPATADGGQFSTTTFPFTADDGSFFPWGYVINSYVNNISLGYLKGPYTIIFSTSGLDTSVFGITKLLYSFGDGKTQTINYPIGNSSFGVVLINAPGDTDTQHTYYPLSLSGTTYTPSITVINGNLTSFIYNITVTLVPGSIYDLDSVHLLNSISTGTESIQSLNILETTTPNYLTHALVLSAQ
jgi:hypothetical protein